MSCNHSVVREPEPRNITPPPQPEAEVDVAIAAAFWESNDGANVAAGLRLARGLARFLANRPEFDAFTDDDWIEFWRPNGRGDCIGARCLATWPGQGGAR